MKFSTKLHAFAGLLLLVFALISTSEGWCQVGVKEADLDRHAVSTIKGSAARGDYLNIRLTNDGSSSEKPRAVVDANYLYVVWEDTRSGNRDIFWQKYNREGVSVAGPVNVSETAGNSVVPSVGVDGSGNSYVVWQEDTPYGTIYGAALDGTGSITAGPLAISSNLCLDPDIGVNANGAIWVAFHRRTASDQDVYVRRFTNQFAQSCELRLNKGTLPAFDKHPSVIADGGNAAHTFWRDMDMWWYDGIYYQGVSPSCGAGDTRLHASGSYDYPDAGYSGEFAWCVAYASGNAYNLYGTSSIYRINDQAGTAGRPRVGDDPNFGYAVWSDTRNTDADIYLDQAYGNTPFTDIRITDDPGSSTNPDIATYNPEPGLWWVVWQDNRDTQTEIYMATNFGPPAHILLDPSTLTFEAIAGGSIPSSQVFQISNDGGGVLDWSIDKDADWLEVSPTQGTSNSQEITVSVNTTDLTPGTYDAIVTITSINADNSPQTVDITYQINSNPQPPVADIGGPYIGQPGDQIQFDASGSYDPDGTIVTYEWDWNNDGTYDEISSEAGTQHSWDAIDEYPITLRVTDNDGMSDEASYYAFVIDGWVFYPGTYDFPCVPGHTECENYGCFALATPAIVGGAHAKCNSQTGFVGVSAETYPPENAALGAWVIHGGTIHIDEPTWVRAAALFSSVGGAADVGLRYSGTTFDIHHYSLSDDENPQIVDVLGTYPSDIDPIFGIDLFMDMIMKIMNYFIPEWIKDFIEAMELLADIQDVVDIKKAMEEPGDDVEWHANVSDPILLEPGNHYFGAVIGAETVAGVGYAIAQRAGVIHGIFINKCDPSELDKSLRVTALCPVTLAVIDPLGRTINKDTSEIPDAMYYRRDINMDTTWDCTIHIPDAISGEYQITVLPDSTAQPSDSFTLFTNYLGMRQIIASDVEISQIPAAPYAVQIHSCGDGDGDAAINIGDAVYLINYIFKSGPAPDPECVGDANGDDTVNIGDAVYLINYIFKSGPEPVSDCCP